MEIKLLWAVLLTAVLVIGLCMFGILRKDNPAVEMATDIVCDVTDDAVCQQVEQLETKE